MESSSQIDFEELSYIHPYQTAPTALFNRSGIVIKELERNKENLLIYDLELTPISFGEQGGKYISDILVD